MSGAVARGGGEDSDREERRGSDEATSTPPPSEASVLVVAQHANPGKIRRHWGPLAAAAGSTTMVCLTPDESVDGIDYVVAPTVGNRYVDRVLLGVVALLEAARGDHDMVASISLFPYGLVALALGTLFRLPTHLGIIGADADRHARAWYGPAVRALFRRFDVVSVPGSAHVESLVEMGVPRERVAVLANAIDVDRYSPDGRAADPTYDFLWIGRFSDEKNPLAFVRALGHLADDGADFRAVMLGSGGLEEEVREAVARAGLREHVDLPGWVDDPADYYRDASVFVLTSRREGLPLTMLEAMATGVAAVVPPVGSVTDVARHDETAYVVPDPEPAALAEGMAALLGDDDLRARLAGNATGVRESYGYDAAREDWRQILAVGLGE